MNKGRNHGPLSRTACVASFIQSFLHLDVAILVDEADFFAALAVVPAIVFVRSDDHVVRRVGPLALASIDLPTVAAEHSGHPGVAKHPDDGGWKRGVPCPGGRRSIHGREQVFFLAVTGCPANGS